MCKCAQYSYVQYGRSYSVNASSWILHVQHNGTAGAGARKGRACRAYVSDIRFSHSVSYSLSTYSTAVKAVH